MDNYDKLMELCGFEAEEAVEYKPTLMAGLEKMLVTEKDVEFAVNERLPQCWSMHLEGMRKLMGCWLREFVRVAIPDPTETRVCHTYFVQPGMAYLHPVKLADPTIQIGAPDWVASFVGAAFFNVAHKYVEAAESEGCAIEQISCNLNKIRYGLHVLGIIPPGGYSIGFRTFCDDAPLVEQLIHEWNGTKVWTPYRVRDIHFSGDPLDDENMKYFAATLEDGHRKLEEWLDIKLTDEQKAESINLFIELSANTVAVLTEFMKADPVPLNANDLAFALLPVATPFDIGYDKVFEAVQILQGEVAQMIAEGKGVMPKGTPRVSWRLLHSWGCPWLVPMCHELGLAADFEEGFLLAQMQFLKTMEAQMETDIYVMLGKQLAAVSAMGTSMDFLYETSMDHIRDYNIDGMISSCYRSCRCWTAHSFILAKMISEREGIPCITPDIDIFIDRGDFPQSRMRTLLETFADMVKRSKAKREAQAA